METIFPHTISSPENQHNIRRHQEHNVNESKRTAASINLRGQLKECECDHRCNWKLTLILNCSESFLTLKGSQSVRRDSISVSK